MPRERLLQHRNFFRLVLRVSLAFPRIDNQIVSGGNVIDALLQLLHIIAKVEI